MKCKYNDCGWCNALAESDRNCRPDTACLKPNECPEYIRQQDEYNISESMEPVAKKYRMLEVGEVIQEGDEVYDDYHGTWSKSSMRGTVGNKIGNWRPQFRRPLPEVHASMEPVTVYEKYKDSIVKAADEVYKLNPFDATAHTNSEWPDEQKSAECSVSIAGGLVHGNYEQIKAVQQAIFDSEELHRLKAEQQAADEREKAIDKMLAVLSEAHSGDASEGLRMATDLYDAGYRLTDKD